jgi:hypothetical protein
MVGIIVSLSGRVEGETRKSVTFSRKPYGLGTGTRDRSSDWQVLCREAEQKLSSCLAPSLIDYICTKWCTDTMALEKAVNTCQRPSFGGISQT